MTAKPGAILFAYGTLMDAAVRRGVLGERSDPETCRATLPGFSVRRMAGFEYTFLVEDVDGSVDGVAILDLDPVDMATLDDYEDVDQGLYERREVTIELWGCGSTMPTRAWVYLGGAALTAG